jgi:hypothetical protein
MTRELLGRLIKDGLVVGYQKQASGKIYHAKAKHADEKGDIIDDYFFDISVIEQVQRMREDYNQTWLPELVNYIHHDRVDQFTGLTHDGTKVFERDTGDEVTPSKVETFTVELIRGTWSMRTYRPRSEWIQDLYRNIKHATIIGIEGVKGATDE